MAGPRLIVGFAIVSEDGMLANAAGVMPDALKFEADKRFFEHGMDGVDVAVHGRHSNESQPHSPQRLRLIVTRTVAKIERDTANPKARFWNPAGAPLEEALAALGVPDARVGVVGATDVFGLFLPHYSDFHLSRAPGVYLPGGRPVFPSVPEKTPEAVLADHGFTRGPRRTLDRAKGVTVTSWRRKAAVPADDGPLDLPAGLAKPALRALAGAGVRRLEQLTALSEGEVARLHGMGPRALEALRRALAERKQSFRG